MQWLSELTNFQHSASSKKILLSFIQNSEKFRHKKNWFSFDNNHWNVQFRATTPESDNVKLSIKAKAVNYFVNKKKKKKKLILYCGGKKSEKKVFLLCLCRARLECKLLSWKTFFFLLLYLFFVLFLSFFPSRELRIWRGWKTIQQQQHTHTKNALAMSCSPAVTSSSSSFDMFILTNIIECVCALLECQDARQRLPIKFLTDFLGLILLGCLSFFISIEQCFVHVFGDLWLDLWRVMDWNNCWIDVA